MRQRISTEAFECLRSLDFTISLKPIHQLSKPKKGVQVSNDNRGDICLRMRQKDNAWSTRIARFLAELKIESVNIMVIRRHSSTVQNKTANTLKITKFIFIKVFFIH